MLISVDLPAPFSPMMPVIEPARDRQIETSRLACTGPNDLSIDAQFDGRAVAAVGFASVIASARDQYGAGVVAHVVVHLDLAGDDVGLGLLDLRLHLGRDQLLVVLVERPVDAAFLQAEHRDAGLPAAVHRGLEAVVGREIDALDHRGQHRAGMQVVLVGVDADRRACRGPSRPAARRCRCAPAAAIDHVDAAIELALGEFAAARRIVPGRAAWCRSCSGSPRRSGWRT